jgi:phosphoribosylformimino-5-aminoimidazole carboxamide ribotide isomerase
MLVIPALELHPEPSRGYVAALVQKIGEWEATGFSRIHLRVHSPDGQPPDLRFLEDVVRDIHVPVQVAGKFDSGDDIEAALSAGAAFVIVGTRALDEMDWLVSAAHRFPDQLLVAAPARERRARTRGAVRALPLDLRDLAAEIGSVSLAGLLVDFPSEAPITYPDLTLLEDIGEDLSFPVQVHGGATDLGMLRDLEFRGVAAAIMSASRLSAEFDEHALAASFSD